MERIAEKDQDFKGFEKELYEAMCSVARKLAQEYLEERDMSIMGLRDTKEFDPHGTTIDVLLKTIPERAADRVRVVRLGDPDNTVPVSMWESDNPDDCEKTINDLNLLFAEIFDPKHEGFVGPRWERWFSIFTSAPIALLGKKASFDSIIAVSQTKESMKKLAFATRHTCPKSSRAIMAEFVNNESKDFGDVISWCVCKFQRLTAIPQLRNTLGAGVNALNFRKTIDTDAVTLIDLASPTIGTHAACIAGALILQQLWSAITAYGSRSKTHIIAVDEAHLFQTNPLPQCRRAKVRHGDDFGASVLWSVVKRRAGTRPRQDLRMNIISATSTRVLFIVALQHSAL